MGYEILRPPTKSFWVDLTCIYNPRSRYFHDLNLEFDFQVGKLNFSSLLTNTENGNNVEWF